MPLDDPAAEPLYPRWPRRIRNLVYGFAWAAQDEAIVLAGGKIQRRRMGG